MATHRPPRPTGTPQRRLASRPEPRPSSARPAVRRQPRVSCLRALLWLALVSFAITLVRLIGELRGWSPEYWSRLPGGGLSPLGITWLIPLVGFLLGWRLQRASVRPSSPLQVMLQPSIALVAAFGALPLLARMRAAQDLPPLSWSVWLGAWAVAALVVVVAAYLAWPALGRPLLAYAFLARVPVAAVMALAMSRHWPTHYAAPPPGFPRMPWLERWLWTGLLPQLTIWIAITVAVGALLGVLGWFAAEGWQRLRSR